MTLSDGRTSGPVAHLSGECFAAALIALGVCLALCGTVIAGETAEVTSDSLKVDSDSKRAHFEGHVNAAIGDLRVRCETLDVTYDDNGQVVSLSATGGVKVTHESTVATAARASLDAANGKLILTGAPRLTRGPHRLSGKQITVHLKSGQLDVIEAKGSFVIPTGAGK